MKASAVRQLERAGITLGGSPNVRTGPCRCYRRIDFEFMHMDPRIEKAHQRRAFPNFQMSLGETGLLRALSKRLVLLLYEEEAC